MSFRKNLRKISLIFVLGFCLILIGSYGISFPRTTQPQPTTATVGGIFTNSQPQNSKCRSVDGKPDPVCTPGVANPNVTQENIYSTICVLGYTATIRPPVSYTNDLKVKQIREYGYVDTNPADYEEDHLIPLELGGDPTDPKNLWPEYGIIPNSKDSIENLCRKKVCNGKMSLIEAQKEIASDWFTACSGGAK